MNANDPATAASRLRTALELAEAGVELMRMNLRRENPGADEFEIKRLLRSWARRRTANEFDDAHLRTRLLAEE